MAMRRGTRLSETDKDLQRQIQDARQKAEEFSRALQRSQYLHTHTHNGRPLEFASGSEVHAAEERNVMVEQLERELRAVTSDRPKRRQQDSNGRISSSNTAFQDLEQQLEQLNGSTLNTTFKDENPRDSFSPTKVHRSELAVMKTRTEAKDVEISNLTMKLEASITRENALKTQVADLEAAWKEAELKLEFRTKQLEALETSQSERDATESELRAQRSSYEHQLKAAQAEIRLTRSNLEMCSTKAMLLEQQLSVRQQSEHMLEERCKKLEERCVVLQTQIQTMHSSEDNALNTTCQQLQRELAMLKDQCKEYEKQMAQLSMQNSTLQAQLVERRHEWRQRDSHHGSPSQSSNRTGPKANHSQLHEDELSHFKAKLHEQTAILENQSLLLSQLAERMGWDKTDNDYPNVRTKTSTSQGRGMSIDCKSRLEELAETLMQQERANQELRQALYGLAHVYTHTNSTSKHTDQGETTDHSLLGDGDGPWHEKVGQRYEELLGLLTSHAHTQDEIQAHLTSLQESQKEQELGLGLELEPNFLAQVRAGIDANVEILGYSLVAPEVNQNLSAGEGNASHVPLDHDMVARGIPPTVNTREPGQWHGQGHEHPCEHDQEHATTALWYREPQRPEETDERRGKDLNQSVSHRILSPSDSMHSTAVRHVINVPAPSTGTVHIRTHKRQTNGRRTPDRGSSMDQPQAGEERVRKLLDSTHEDTAPYAHEALHEAFLNAGVHALDPSHQPSRITQRVSKPKTKTKRRKSVSGRLQGSGTSIMYSYVHPSGLPVPPSQSLPSSTSYKGRSKRMPARASDRSRLVTPVVHSRIPKAPPPPRANVMRQSRQSMPEYGYRLYAHTQASVDKLKMLERSRPPALWR